MAADEDADKYPVRHLLFAVRCGTRKNRWAVGFQQRSGGPGQSEALAWKEVKRTVR